MTPDALKSLIKPFQTAMFDVEEASARAVLNNLFAPDATLHMCYPFGDLSGPDALWETCIGPLHAAMPDLERRDMIVLAGTTPEGRNWIGCMGNYMGTFVAPFMEIPQREDALPLTTIKPPWPVAPKYWLASPSMTILPDMMFSPVPGPADPCTCTVACLFMPPQ